MSQYFKDRNFTAFIKDEDTAIVVLNNRISGLTSISTTSAEAFLNAHPNAVPATKKDFAIAMVIAATEFEKIMTADIMQVEILAEEVCGAFVKTFQEEVA